MRSEAYKTTVCTIMNQDEENGGEINDLVEEVQKNEEELEDGIHFALVTRRLLKTQVTENDVDDQRDNLFHTRCLVKGTALLGSHNNAHSRSR